MFQGLLLGLCCAVSGKFLLRHHGNEQDRSREDRADRPNSQSHKMKPMKIRKGETVSLLPTKSGVTALPSIKWIAK